MSRPLHVLCVAEKPSVAKAIADILSNGQARRRVGLSKYNALFEFPYSWRGRNGIMVVTSVTGHLMELDFTPRHRNWQGHAPATLFAAPVVKTVAEDKQPVAEQLRVEAKKANVLLLMLDCDREGENIAYEVIDVCGGANKNLDIWRARFASIMPGEIQNACANPVRPNKLEADAVDMRQELDLRVGAAFTRYLTLRYQCRYDGLTSVISYGPCQFPTLGFVVHRYNQVEAFVPEPFWYLSLEVVKDNKTVVFKWDRVRLFDQAVCTILYEQCLNDAAARVTHVQTKPTTKYRPFPMTTVKFQVRPAPLS